MCLIEPAGERSSGEIIILFQYAGDGEKWNISNQYIWGRNLPVNQ
jgi:hypothetical protein